MKRLLFLLLLAPVCSYGQNFELGLNGGLCFHSIPKQNSFVYNDKPTLSLAGALSANLQLPGWQIGINVEVTKLKEYNYLIPLSYQERQNVLVADPLIFPHAVLNKTIPMGAGYFYAGASVGPVVARVGVNTWQYDANGQVTGYTTAYNSATGFAGGLQVGIVLHGNDRVGINAEAAMRYASFTYDDPQRTTVDNPYKYRVFYFPMTVGIRYRI